MLMSRAHHQSALWRLDPRYKLCLCFLRACIEYFCCNSGQQCRAASVSRSITLKGLSIGNNLGMLIGNRPARGRIFCRFPPFLE